MRKADAIAHFGSVAQVAAALGISTQAVSQWGELIPPLRAIVLQRVTRGALKPDYPGSMAGVDIRRVRRGGVHGAKSATEALLNAPNQEAAAHE